MSYFQAKNALQNRIRCIFSLKIWFSWESSYQILCNILPLEMASPENRHCANCIGALSFPILTEFYSHTCSKNRKVSILTSSTEWGNGPLKSRDLGSVLHDVDMLRPLTNSTQSNTTVLVTFNVTAILQQQNWFNFLTHPAFCIALHNIKY